MYIRKSDGTEQEFQEEKLAQALERARITGSTQQEIVRDVSRMIHPGTSTGQVHDRVLHALEARDPLAAARYHLKRAMLHLGPTGFPFEVYFSRLMQSYGWKTEVGARVPGKCVLHEVDIYAKRNGETRAVEAKYHNTAGGRTDVKVALYVHARHLDLQAKDPGTIGMLVTNTTFTSDAIAYGECVEMKMKAWNYPANMGLAHYIEELQLYPVTVFPQLPPQAIGTLMKHRFVLAKDLCELPATSFRQYGFSSATSLQHFQSLAHQLCSTDHS